MSGYQEYHYFSNTHGMDMVRVSMFNDKGHEFWANIEEASGRGYRDRLAAAVERIEHAVYSGKEPGEVTLP